MDALSQHDLRLQTLGELYSEAPEPANYLVDGLLLEGGSSILAARPKAGKSHLYRQLALCIARGEPFLGRATKQGPVVIFSIEDGKSTVTGHFKRMGADSDEPIHFRTGPAPIDPLGALKRAIELVSPKLVVIDTLQKFTRIKDIDSYSEVAPAMGPFTELGRESGVHVMFIHHNRKAQADGMASILGSTGLTAATDTNLVLGKKLNFTGTLESEGRDGTTVPPTHLSFDKERLWYSAGEAVQADSTLRMEQEILTFLAARGSATREEVCQAIKGNSENRSGALKRLVEMGRIVRAGKGSKSRPHSYSLACLQVAEPPTDVNT